VQFYEDDAALSETVADYLAAGMRAGDRLIVIATAAHRSAFESRLRRHHVDPDSPRESLREPCWLDADETLASFMIDGMPDPQLFAIALARALGGDRPRLVEPSRTRVRAYGEMVDLLWQRGNGAAAIRLEALWTAAARRHGFALLCAYHMDNFGGEADSSGFLDVCRSHDHVIASGVVGRPSRDDDDDAHQREIALLQQRARALEGEIQRRKELESTLLSALAERARVEQELRASIEREREARQRAEASDAFKQMFLGMLGHDLRNPLSTILTTARMMTLRRELAPESHKRIERVISSAERMRRMIEQILDVTRARLAAGIPVRLGDKLDLIARVLKIVDEVRSAHPGRVIVFEPESPCRARVDGDRFEQVVSNLLGNAITHGDPRRPITVCMTRDARAIRIGVHNHGPAIDPAFLPLLFDPFERGGNPLGHSDGLGLGLYISKCIIEAHGGTIEVESKAKSGTRFEVTVPRA
jgi:signal transduction histidine kinase